MTIDNNNNIKYKQNQLLILLATINNINKKEVMMYGIMGSPVRREKENDPITVEDRVL